MLHGVCVGGSLAHAENTGGWDYSPTQTGGGPRAADRGESPEPDVFALILSLSSSDEERIIADRANDARAFLKF